MNNGRLPQRKSPRLPAFDYTTPNYYFVTICTYNKRNLFGMPGQLNELGMIAEREFGLLSQRFPDIKIDNYVVMPNHVHAIIVLTDQKSALPAVVGSYKAHVTLAIHQQWPVMAVWQRSFHDHVIRDQESYEKIWNYVVHNPNKWSEDCFFEP